MVCVERNTRTKETCEPSTADSTADSTAKSTCHNHLRQSDDSRLSFFLFSSSWLLSLDDDLNDGSLKACGLFNMGGGGVMLVGELLLERSVGRVSAALYCSHISLVGWARGEDTFIGRVFSDRADPVLVVPCRK